MITVKKFIFNGFQVNTYVLSDETKECIIIDAANYEASEDAELANYIEKEQLKPIAQYSTHCHVDHVLGSAFVETKFNLGLGIHPDSKVFLETAIAQGAMYGFNLKSIPKLAQHIQEGAKITFGHSELEVVYTPGHADGSICLINHDQKFVITGDVLFHESIGRTDLPTGNFDVLHQNIMNKLFTLSDVYKVYPGHGPETSIGHEKINNPFL